MYGDPDPYSTAVKPQSYQGEYLDFTIACAAVCVTGAKTRGEGEGSEGKSSKNEKKVFFSSLLFTPPFFTFFNRLI